jgi:hypothetical protein
VQGRRLTTHANVTDVILAIWARVDAVVKVVGIRSDIVTGMGCNASEIPALDGLKHDLLCPSTCIGTSGVSG